MLEVLQKSNLQQMYRTGDARVESPHDLFRNQAHLFYIPYPCEVIQNLLFHRQLVDRGRRDNISGSNIPPLIDNIMMYQQATRCFLTAVPTPPRG